MKKKNYNQHCVWLYAKEKENVEENFDAFISNKTWKSQQIIKRKQNVEVQHWKSEKRSENLCLPWIISLIYFIFTIQRKLGQVTPFDGATTIFIGKAFFLVLYLWFYHKATLLLKQYHEATVNSRKAMWYHHQKICSWMQKIQR